MSRIRSEVNPSRIEILIETVFSFIEKITGSKKKDNFEDFLCGDCKFRYIEGHICDCMEEKLNEITEEELKK